jgi:hypothetical protein
MLRFFLVIIISVVVFTLTYAPGYCFEKNSKMQQIKRILYAKGVKDPFGLKSRSLSTLVKINDYPFFIMEYYGNYNFKEHAIKTNKPGEKKGLYFYKACSTFSALNKKGDIIFGHNIDWSKFPMLLLFIYPSEGIKSVSLVGLDNLGFHTKDPDLSSYADLIKLLKAPYFPHDGMNEFGVAIGEMTVKGDIVYDPKKRNLGPLHLIRQVLDNAKNLNEAISLFKRYNNTTGDIHYLISDSSGQSAVIEYIKGEIVVSRNTEPWQIATNFIINNENPERLLYQCRRFKQAHLILKRVNGLVSQVEAMNILEEVSLDNLTQWSVIYNLSTGEISGVVGRQYQRVMKFNFPLTQK